VFPRPGSQSANPQTTISFRGIASGAIGAISVTGDKTGVHQGRWVAHSDGEGASFDPSTAFAPGEHITVHTHLDVLDAGGDTFGFTVERPSSVTATIADPDEPTAAAAARAAASPLAATDVHHYITRPDLTPPIMTVNPTSGTPAPGLIAVTPQTSQVLLMSSHGNPVWNNPIPGPDHVLDAKIIHLNGNDDVAWWQGTIAAGYGFGRYEVVDNHYNHLLTIHAGNGYQADLHDMEITSNNTALVGAYNTLMLDTTAFGGAPNSPVLEYVVQEVDIPTGAVLFEWHSADDVPLSKSQTSIPPNPGTAWDYFHGNAVAQDSDGNILVSGRHTSNIYKINHSTGALMWTLGKGGDFTPTFATQNWFNAQHDIRRVAPGKLSVFDNGCCAGPASRNYSRGFVLNVDEVNKTASEDREVRHTPDILAGSQGDFRMLPNGDQFIGWGAVGEMTEFDANGNPVADLSFPDPMQSYRAVKTDFHGFPTRPPDLSIGRTNNLVSARVSWNGATDVALWVMRAGEDADHLKDVAKVIPTSFETGIAATTPEPVIVVEARDANGKALGSVTTVFTSNVPVNAGYFLARSDGSISGFGTATVQGNALVPLGQKAVGIARVAGGGYIVATSGGTGVSVASTLGTSSLGGAMTAPIVGIAATPTGNGYWLVGSDGNVYPKGDAKSFGSMLGKHLNAPVAAIAAAPDGKGYWLAAKDGGVFTFGSARFAGSMATKHLNQPVIGIAAASTTGYWLSAADGGLFTFGTARFLGSMAGKHINAPVVGIAAGIGGSGYWLAGSDGGVYTFGMVKFVGSMGSSSGGAPFVGIARG
jgi:hypothetical protein